MTENVSPDELLNTILAIESRDERAITADGKRSGDCNISANESSAQLSKDKTADDPKEELVKDAKSKTDSTKKTSEKTETTKKSNSDSGKFCILSFCINFVSFIPRARIVNPSYQREDN